MSSPSSQVSSDPMFRSLVYRSTLDDAGDSIGRCCPKKRKLIDALDELKDLYSPQSQEMPLQDDLANRIKRIRALPWSEIEEEDESSASRYVINAQTISDLSMQIYLNTGGSVALLASIAHLSSTRDIDRIAQALWLEQQNPDGPSKPSSWHWWNPRIIYAKAMISFLRFEKILETNALNIARWNQVTFSFKKMDKQIAQLLRNGQIQLLSILFLNTYYNELWDETARTLLQNSLIRALRQNITPTQRGELMKALCDNDSYHHKNTNIRRPLPSMMLKGLKIMQHDGPILEALCIESQKSSSAHDRKLITSWLKDIVLDGGSIADTLRRLSNERPDEICEILTALTPIQFSGLHVLTGIIGKDKMIADPFSFYLQSVKQHSELLLTQNDPRLNLAYALDLCMLFPFEEMIQAAAQRCDPGMFRMTLHLISQSNPGWERTDLKKVLDTCQERILRERQEALDETDNLRKRIPSIYPYQTEVV